METELEGENQAFKAETTEDQDLCFESSTNESGEADASEDSQQARPTSSYFRRPEELLPANRNVVPPQLLHKNLLARISLIDKVLLRMPHRLIQRSLGQDILKISRTNFHPVNFPPPLPRIADHLVRISLPINPLITNPFRELLNSLALPFHDTLQGIFDRVVIPFPPIVSPRARLASDLGWVVHDTLPHDILDMEDEENLDEAILNYYTTEWDTVKREITTRTNAHLIDEDSKAIMMQALEAHEKELYRLVPRSLIIEIERAVRVNLNKKMAGQGVNIKNKILEGVEDLPASALQDISAGMIQYETVDSHLYENIKDDETRLQFTESPIPNRHAVAHGLVPYSSKKSSLNSIFLADFAFLIITEMKRQNLMDIVDILTAHLQEAGPISPPGTSSTP